MAALLPAACSLVFVLSSPLLPSHAGEPPRAGGVSRPSPAPPESEAERFRSEAGDRIFFAEASADLGSRARVALEAQAVWLLAHPQVRLIVEGHSDDPGNEQANLQLSQQRADLVRERLIGLGLAPERVTALGVGRARPAAVCNDPACSAHNRRVVLQIGDRRSAEQEPLSGNAAGPLLRTRPPARRLF